MASNLDIDAQNAKALGLSYGKYKALHYKPAVVPPAVEPVAAPTNKICPICGKPVPRKRLKYCSDMCRTMHKRQNSYDYYYRVTKAKKEGLRNADS